MTAFTLLLARAPYERHLLAREAAALLSRWSSRITRLASFSSYVPTSRHGALSSLVVFSAEASASYGAFRSTLVSFSWSS